MTEFHFCKFVNMFTRIDKRETRNFHFVLRQFLPAVITNIFV